MSIKKYIRLIPVKAPNTSTHSYDFTSLKICVLTGFLQGEGDQVFATHAGWLPKEKEVVYFIPGCEVPRFKVREKFKITNKPSNATVAFVGKKVDVEESYINSKCYVIPAEAVLKWLEQIYEEDNFFVTKFKSVLLNCENKILISMEDDVLLQSTPTDSGKTTNNSGRYGVSDTVDRLYETVRRIDGWEGFTVWGKATNNFIETFCSPHEDSLITRLKCPIYPEREIVSMLNTERLVLNEERYKEFRKMGQTGDEQTIILMMELMANCNFQKSAVYLHLLIKEFATQISKLKQVHHVNFKALLNYLELDPRKLDNTSIEQLTAFLRKHKQFTRINIQRLTQFYAKEGTQNFTSALFTTGPVLKPEAEKYLDDDFVSDSHEIEIPDDN